MGVCYFQRDRRERPRRIAFLEVQDRFADVFKARNKEAILSQVEMKYELYTRPILPIQIPAHPQNRRNPPNEMRELLRFITRERAAQ